jgi:hypothetical protein
MRGTGRLISRALKPLSILAVAVVIALMAASCGGETGSSESTSNTTKLPPGATGETLADTESSAGATAAQATSENEQEDSTTSSNSTTSNSTTSNELVKTVYLSGANFAVVSAVRDDSNDAALTSSTRELTGDFLQIELTVTNVGDELFDLSDFSFRLWNPAIDADLYEDFYGSDGTYGSYVSENIISATLLDYETLQPISYKLRIGETADNLMLFYDLNPQSTAKNEGVTLAGTNLIIYDADSGNAVEINLSGYTE